MVLPSSLDIQQAIDNINLYISLFSVVRLERNLAISLRPEISLYGPHFSSRTLPDLITEVTGPITIREFFEAPCNDEVKVTVEELQMDLVPLADLLRDSQLNLVDNRLIHLREVLEDIDFC